MVSALFRLKLKLIETYPTFLKADTNFVFGLYHVAANFAALSPSANLTFRKTIKDTLLQVLQLRLR